MESTYLEEQSQTSEDLITPHMLVGLAPSKDFGELSTNSNTQTELQYINNPEQKSYLIKLSDTCSDPNSWSIFKVPFGLRQVNEKAYEPRIVSIGPYHHGKEHLKMMEIIKESCLRRIIGEVGVEVEEIFVTAMEDMEKEVRKSYSETFDDIKRNAFVKMMILDGCFIIDLFRHTLPSRYFFELNCTKTQVSYDLLLLENQLPFSVLYKLYSIIKMSNVEKGEFARLAEMDELARLSLRHFSHLVPGLPKDLSGNIDYLRVKHLLGIVHNRWIPHHATSQGHGSLSKFIRCATELAEAGIKFVNKDGESSILFDIEFSTGDAKELCQSLYLRIATLNISKVLCQSSYLRIPTLNIDDNTELILRNFMAYEQFIPRSEPTYVCDYVTFMDNLMDTDKDVQLLCHSGVIVNWLGDDDAVAQMFNRLRDFTYTTAHSFYYKKIYDEVEKHCQKKQNKWKATLNKDYFNSPWSIIKVVAAIVLLLLTAAQTIFSVLSYFHPQ